MNEETKETTKECTKGYMDGNRTVDRSFVVCLVAGWWLYAISRAGFDPVRRIRHVGIEPEPGRVGVGVEERVKVEVFEDVGVFQRAKIKAECRCLVWSAKSPFLRLVLTSGMLKSLSGCCVWSGGGCTRG